MLLTGPNLTVYSACIINLWIFPAFLCNFLRDRYFHNYYLLIFNEALFQLYAKYGQGNTLALFAIAMIKFCVLESVLKDINTNLFS